MFTLPKKSSVKSATLYAVLVIALIAMDYTTKSLIVSRYPLGRTIPVIEGVFHFTYVRNTGAAFGMFSDNTVALTILSVLILVGIVLAMVFIKPKGEPVRLAVCMICAGAVGNIIDRIRYGYVVDFIDVRLIRFAVFNLADCFVCIGAFLLVIYIISHKEFN